MTEVIGVARSSGDADQGRSRASKRHVPGEPGIWVLLFGDMMVFTVLFTVYLHQRGVRPALFAESQGALNRALGATNTLVLLTSSILVVFATHALQRPELRHLARPLTLGGALVGSCFVAIKAYEYHEKVSAGITPSTNEFFMYYFVLTGLHLAHVIIGLIVLTVLSTLARKPEPTKTHLAFFEGGACFWHMVDLLWIVIYPLIFLVR
ncbi:MULTISPECIES: cytochrome c oxidase subunit 3 [Mycobacterium]|uniref:Probable cytochrome c oxidase subunit 3 n=1 Tax=Mycobacterium kiyosense TaxID=2871094 RepID=A0A9P3Q495_9MYCO|nr:MULTISPECIES: cytochrome c oxidase subunit 3 [Mycobacterium]BDB44315.1 cytochrome c oxidase subunit III [Mycobacterium kiyosense]BDE15842.1 cytochrome c oxidase subunit III [Mycobacterium sp. 20KCMC460]GLB80764.1 cytochrome c oxidase subunit III [Mycobacterium kiyosense]GLB87498.1 cytochrome c oxidase subunit III [Mycobacterium kiyosense]GLB93244.1 cytochrome c oxidase subunit III [Mycobacterium kiyosense]